MNTHTQSSNTIRSKWNFALIHLVLLTFFLIGIYFPTAKSFIHVWNTNGTFQYAYFIFPIFGFLIWERRTYFAKLAPQPFYPGLIALLLSLGAWLVAHTANIMEGEQIAFMAIFQSSLLVILGWRVYLSFLFPLCYLWFLVPTGEFILPHLQVITTEIAVFLLKISNIAFYRQGFFLSTPGGEFEVAIACAGIKFLFATIVFGALYANVIYKSWSRRIIFFTLSIIVPILANGARVYGIIMIAYFSDGKYGAGADHLIYGWFFFTLVLILLIAIGMLFREDHLEKALPHYIQHPPKNLIANGQFISATILTIFCIISAPLYTSYLKAHPPLTDLSRLTSPTTTGSNWKTVQAPTLNWIPIFSTADKTIHQAYEKEGHSLELFIAFYTNQTETKKIYSVFNQQHDGFFWKNTHYTSTQLTLNDQALSVPVTLISNQSQKAVIVQWNWIDGQFTSSTLKSLLLSAKSELLPHQERSAATILILCPFDTNEQEAIDRIQDYLRNISSLDMMLKNITASQK